MPNPLQPNNFDLLRLFAASQVVCGHTVSHLDLSLGKFDWIVAAFPGVPIFFVLSGFLISAAWERNPNLFVYGKNRVLRIFPALWTCILLTIAVAVVFGFSFFSAEALLWVVLQGIGLIYTPGFLDSFGFGSYNGSLWTIPVELQFYVILPAIYFLASRHGTASHWSIAGLLVFLVAAYLYLHHAPALDDPELEPLEFKLVRYSFIPHVYLFFAGVLMQRFQIHACTVIRGKGLYWIIAYLVFASYEPLNEWGELAGRLMLGITVISVAFTMPGLSRKLLSDTDISYGVYIYHGLLINIFVELGKTDNWLFGAGIFVLTYLLGYLSWIIVEKPCIRRKAQTIRA